jgi:hypothetical protein
MCPESGCTRKSTKTGSVCLLCTPLSWSQPLPCCSLLLRSTPQSKKETFPLPQLLSQALPCAQRAGAEEKYTHAPYLRTFACGLHTLPVFVLLLVHCKRSLSSYWLVHAPHPVWITPRSSKAGRTPERAKLEGHQNERRVSEAKLTYKRLPTLRSKRIWLHRPGIEPGAPRWQRRILPLNYRCRI